VMAHNTGASWEIVIDGRARSWRDDRDIAREAGRYLKAKNSKSDVSVRNIVTGEVLALGDASVNWADGKTRR
jgi:hypothetical protein